MILDVMNISTALNSSSQELSEIIPNSALFNFSILNQVKLKRIVIGVAVVWMRFSFWQTYLFVFSFVINLFTPHTHRVLRNKRFLRV